jgi:hypothetical protein
LEQDKNRLTPICESSIGVLLRLMEFWRSEVNASEVFAFAWWAHFAEIVNRHVALLCRGSK